ncbi:MAG: methionyl-tRNA formyltransferase [Prevotellaceae bacterium]|jgi:methionyl-tRNA formyltransferase|nr:methionyl-tRNA formyltransferase [Prevotellaceae bacterium]
MPLRIVYMGTPEFAVAPLKALFDGGYQIAGVVTVPDRPAGRGRHLQASAVKTFALAHGLPLAQPEHLRDDGFLRRLREWQADVFTIVAFRMLPEEVFSIPPRGTFNLHASLLPQYRGAAPINHAIMNGEKQTGVTTFFIDKNMDTGRLIFSEPTAIADDENAGQLHDRLMEMGVRLVLRTVDAITRGTVDTIPQPRIPEGKLKTAPKITKETRQINWRHPAEAIHNRIRGLSPAPAATTSLLHRETKTLTLVKIITATCDNTPHNLSPGTLRTDGKRFLKIAGGHGSIAITRLQPAGKQAMNIAEWLAGFRHPEHYLFI